MPALFIISDMDPICPAQGIWYCDDSSILLPEGPYEILGELIGSETPAIGIFFGKYASLMPAYIIAKIEKETGRLPFRVSIRFLDKLRIDSQQFLDELDRFLREIRRLREPWQRAVILERN